MNTFSQKHTFLLLFLFFSISHSKAQFTPGTSYFGVNNYIEYIAGDLPIIIVAPHAGNLFPAELPDINSRGADNGTLELINFMKNSIPLKTGGCRPHIIINHLSPSKLNPVFAQTDSIMSAGTNTTALMALNQFHNFIQIAHNKVSADWGKGHYFEFHGNDTSEEWNMIGLGISKTNLNSPDSVILTKVNQSTVKNLCTTGGANFLEVLKGVNSLGGMLNSLGWKSTTSPSYPAPSDSQTFFYAGQNTWRYGSKDSGTIDATHLESYWKFMVLTANQARYSNDLANSILQFMNLHYGFNFDCQSLHLDEIETTSEKIKIYPNPVQDFLYFDKEIEQMDFEISNFLGQTLRKGFFQGKVLNISLLPRGAYILILRKNKKITTSLKFFKI
jgi:Secretion system C-terminal sorting domain